MKEIAEQEQKRLIRLCEHELAEKYDGGGGGDLSQRFFAACGNFCVLCLCLANDNEYTFVC